MGRTPHGVRGLKYSCHYNHLVKIMSHPTRGAWIEILTVAESPLTSTSRTPHGVRGLKYPVYRGAQGRSLGRTPHGVRGLKYLCAQGGPGKLVSHPTRGAWIEI